MTVNCDAEINAATPLPHVPGHSHDKI